MARSGLTKKQKRKLKRWLENDKQRKVERKTKAA
jgi:hypothetical protein